MPFVFTILSLLTVAGSLRAEGEPTFFRAIETDEEFTLNDDEVREIVFDDLDEDDEE